MTRVSQSVLLLTLSQVVTLIATPTAVGDPVLKLYDLRDLIGLIAPPPRAGESADPSRHALSEAAVLSALAPTAEKSRPSGPPEGPVEQLMDRLHGALPLGFSQIRLLPGVYAIETEEEGHAQLEKMLEQIRSLYAERYQVEIVWFRVPTERTPSIGGEVTTEEPVHRHDAVVVRRTPTPLVAVTRHTFISGMQPVVAQGAVGYEPLTAVREEGLKLSVLVGAGREDKQSTMMDITGDIRQVAMGKTSGPLTRDNLEVELPKVSVHSIQSHLRVPLGKRTVLTVVDGFAEGESIVLAASVRKVAQ